MLTVCGLAVCHVQESKKPTKIKNLKARAFHNMAEATCKQKVQADRANFDS